MTRRKVVVLLVTALVFAIGLGGLWHVFMPSSDLNDTWIWTGNDWRQMDAGPAPLWRSGAIFVYNDASKVFLFFGGSDLNDRNLGDTWTLDGRRWQQKHSANGPSARNGALGAYDPMGRRVIMFGGWGGGVFVNAKLAETWSWVDGEWQQLQPASSPPASSIWNDLLFDPTKNRLTLFGGHIVGAAENGTWTPETWVWENSDWTEVPSSGAPTYPYFSGYSNPRVNLLYTDWSAGAIKSVAFRQQFETGHGPSPLAQSWNGNESTWVGDQPVSWIPSSAYGGGYTFFTPKRYLLSFGASTCDIHNDDQTWTWNGIAWARLHPQTTPPPRRLTYLAFDSAHGRVVMFGGAGEDSCGPGSFVPI